MNVSKAIAAAVLNGLAAAPLGFAVPARADETVGVCSDGFSGIATGVTSCPFAQTARQAWYNHRGANPIQVISPVTGAIPVLAVQLGSGRCRHTAVGATARPLGWRLHPHRQLRRLQRVRRLHAGQLGRCLLGVHQFVGRQPELIASGAQSPPQLQHLRLVQLQLTEL